MKPLPYDKVKQMIPPMKGFSATPSVRYKTIDIECRAPIDTDDATKWNYSFDESLERLRISDYERHLRSNEYVDFLLDTMHDGKTDPLKSVRADLLSSGEEWLSLALERQGNTLICHTDPDGWHSTNGVYRRTSQFSSLQSKSFDITGIPSSVRLSLTDFGNDLITVLYGRPLHRLPPIYQREGSIILPRNNSIQPVCAGGSYGLRFTSMMPYGASRGVREVRP